MSQPKTIKEVLEKAIQKAIEGGWEPLSSGLPTSITQWRGTNSVEVAVIYGWDNEVLWVRELEGIIFNHDFAKALWGVETIKETNKYYGDPKWQHHLQQMVIADDPIKYLGDNLPIENSKKVL